MHVRLIKFITWLSITNPWPFKIIQLLDSPSFHLNGAHNCSCQFSLMSDEAVFSVISPSAVPVFTCSMYAHVCTVMHAHMYWCMGSQEITIQCLPQSCSALLTLETGFS